MNITVKEQADLMRAVELLEYPSITAKITSLIGSPIERVMAFLPEKTKQAVDGLTNTALKRATEVALMTLKDQPSRPSSNRAHQFSVACTGALGGAFGLGVLAVELPISTTIMLRSIADIARSEGELLGSVECKLACLEVFALGGPNEGDDDSETGYYTTRILLARATQDLAEKLVKNGVLDVGAPIFMRFLSKIAERFGIQLTEKLVAQAVPAIGALGGATINTLFLEHYQRMARGHFIIRRLERKYGKKIVKSLYARAYQELQFPIDVQITG